MAQYSPEIERSHITRLPDVNFDNLVFGEQFSDHQYELLYHEDTWGSPRIIPYGPIPVFPAVTTLHYGQAVFEGMKAFRYRDGRINIFRLEDHYNRFVRSCERLCIPPVPRPFFVEGIKTLIDIDREWVPRSKYKSLYIRPIVFASDQTLGLRRSRSYRFHILCGPVGDYYSEGIKPIRLTTMPQYVRAVQGGVGDVKVPGNYAASLKPTLEAQEKGYTQVLWLDAREHRFVEEVGSMNIFFVIDDVLVTPPLNGTILPGITRSCVLELALLKGLRVDERPVSIDELIGLHGSGSLSEIFGSGTAAVISPVGHIHHQGRTITILSKEMGPVARWFYDQITAVHHGEIPDEKSWCTII